MVEFNRETDQLEEVKFDLELILPIDLIRQHTKTDDVPSVSDLQLELYRRAALEAAEEYTGMKLFGQDVVIEDVMLPEPYGDRMWRQSRRTFRHMLSHPVAGNFVWYYGFNQEASVKVPVLPGSRQVDLPMDHFAFGHNSCCNPCSGTGATSKVMYRSGANGEKEIPAQIALGALKYIAHVIENPGDSVGMFTAGTGEARGGSHTASNPALASGAIDIWRTVVLGAAYG